MPKKKNVPSRRRYEDDFKAEAVQMLLDGHSASVVASRLGLSSHEGRRPLPNDPMGTGSNHSPVDARRAGCVLFPMGYKGTISHAGRPTIGAICFP
jgi:hypothetical protein